jgi:hypothetical protein
VTPTGPAIEARDLTKTHAKDVRALDDVYLRHTGPASPAA